MVNGVPGGIVTSASANVAVQSSTQPSGTNARPQTWAGVPNGAILPTAVGKPPPGRDPKSRARSRDYLKQCLQEITYLTSTQALNPLPNRPILSQNPPVPQQGHNQPQNFVTSQPMVNSNSLPSSSNSGNMGPGIPLSLPNLPAFDHPQPQHQSAFLSNTQQQQQQQQQSGFGSVSNPPNQASTFNGRPRKVVPEVVKDFPMLNGLGPGPSNATVQQTPGAQPNQQNPSEQNTSLLTVDDKPKDRTGLGLGSPGGGSRQQLEPAADLGLSLERKQKHTDAPNDPSNSGESDVSQLTAIFRPDAAGEWKERLKAAAEAVERAKGSSLSILFYIWALLMLCIYSER